MNNSNDIEFVPSSMPKLMLHIARGIAAILIIISFLVAFSTKDTYVVSFVIELLVISAGLLFFIPWALKSLSKNENGLKYIKLRDNSLIVCNNTGQEKVFKYATLTAYVVTRFEGVAARGGGIPRKRLTLQDTEDPTLKVENLNLGAFQIKGKFTPTNHGSELIDLLKQKGVKVTTSFRVI